MARIRLTESSLRKMIKESVRRALNEAHDGGIGWDDDVANDFDEIKELVGADKLLEEMAMWLGQDRLRKFIDFYKRVYLDDYYNEEDQDDYV